MAKNRLSKLRIDEVASVDRPANPAARAILAKRAGVNTTQHANGGWSKTTTEGCEDHDSPDACRKAGCKNAPIMKRDVGSQDGGGDSDATVLKAAMDEYTDALNESIASIMEDPSVVNKQEMIDKSFAQFQKAVLALTVDGDAITTGVHDMPENNSVLKGLTPEQTEAVNKFIADAASAVKAEAEKVAKAMGDRVEAVEKANKDLRDSIAKRERMAKAEKLVGNTAIKPDVVEKFLETATPEAEAFVADLIAKYSTAIEAGSVLRELGSHPALSGFEKSVDEKSPEGQLQAVVKSLREKEPKLTAQQAYAKALELNPELYEEIVSSDEK